MAKHYKKAKKSYNVIYFTLIGIVILSILYIAQYFINKYHFHQESHLLNSISIDTNKITDKRTERMLKVEQLQTENSDIVGWLEIEGTKINYPVLQGKDNHYYMTHNYKKEKTPNGSLFLDKDYNWDIPSNNLLIYGHNIKDGTMFQNLLEYKDENYFKQHPIIKFTTEKEDKEYEIIAVFESRVYYQSEQNVFRYYYFLNEESKQEYENFVQQAKDASLYETGKTAHYGEQLITLSTCSYHTEDGRFAVIAREK